ncbi:hypothetical protein ACKKLW_005464, partial [Escherichia coli]
LSSRMVISIFWQRIPQTAFLIRPSILTLSSTHKTPRHFCYSDRRNTDNHPDKCSAKQRIPWVFTVIHKTNVAMQNNK